MDSLSLVSVPVAPRFIAGVVKGPCSCRPWRESIHIKPEKVKCKCTRETRRFFSTVFSQFTNFTAAGSATPLESLIRQIFCNYSGHLTACGSSLEFFLRWAWQPAAAMPTAEKTVRAAAGGDSCWRVPALPY